MAVAGSGSEGAIVTWTPPHSSIAKPVCMKNTRIAQMKMKRLLTHACRSANSRAVMAAITTTVGTSDE